MESHQFYTLLLMPTPIFANSAYSPSLIYFNHHVSIKEYWGLPTQIDALSAKFPFIFYSDKRSSLHFAAVAGDDKIVELLIQHGADVHLRDR